MGLMRLTHLRPEIAPEASVRDAVELMTKAEIGAIAIRRPGGPTIEGVFTERDLMRRVVARGRDPATTLVKDVMTSHVITVLDSASVSVAAATMRAHRMRHLVIVDESGGYLGMLAQRHLLYDLMNDLSMKVEDLTSYVMHDGPGG